MKPRGNNIYRDEKFNQRYFPYIQERACLKWTFIELFQRRKILTFFNFGLYVLTIYRRIFVS